MPIVPAGRSDAPFHDLLHWLYSANPFYVISAGLVFVGLRSTFDTAGDTFQTNGLMFGMTGYVLVLAASACFLIRFGKVWDDVRTMLLLVVLLCLAISVCFDDALATDPAAGAWYYYAGLAFTVLVSEGLLRGIRLRLPGVYRIPYYVILALFFLYPVALGHLVASPDDPRLSWGLAGFATCAGLAFFTLLPAARRGPRVVRNNGSPWKWPLYPWTLFGTLALGVLGRAHYLCVSMHFVAGEETIFRPYFWIPFLLVLNLLLLEMLLSVRRSVVLPCLIAIPLGLLTLSATGPSAVAAPLDFAATFTGTVGATPLFCTAVAIAVFHGYCIARRVPHTADVLSVWLLLFCVVGPATSNPASLIAPIGLPFVLAAAIQLVLAVRRRSALRGVLAAGCLTMGLAIGYRELLLTVEGGFVLFHALLAFMLLIGAIARDRFGRVVRHVGAGLLAAAGTAAVFLPTEALVGDPEWLGKLLVFYPYLAMGVALAYAYFVLCISFYGSALVILAAALSEAGWRGYVMLRRMIEGWDYLFFGFLFFALAMLISLSKAGRIRQREDRGGRRERGDGVAAE